MPWLGFQGSRVSWHQACGSTPLLTLRISRIDSDDGTLLRIDGRLDEEALGELEQACEGARLPLTLNLEGMLSLDDRAVETLQRLQAAGANVVNASPYIALRLKSEEE